MSAPRLSLSIRRRRERRIVEAAARLFSDHPYGAVQMDGVARAAGVAKPTLYRYFAAKEDLFLEALGGILAELEQQAEAASAAAGSAGEALERAVAIVLVGLGRCAGALHAVDGSEAALGDRGRAVIRKEVKRLRGGFARIVKRGVASGEFGLIDPEIAAGIILGAIRMTAATVEPDKRGAAAVVVADVLAQGLAGRKGMAAWPTGSP